MDRRCDIDLPRLFSALSVDGKAREIIRALAPDERAALAERAEGLRRALMPFDPEESAQVEASIAAMLTGFRSMRLSDEAAEATVGITARVLADYPAWAITRACLMVAAGEAGLDRRYPPNDSQLCDVVGQILAPYRVALARAEALLRAPVEPPAARLLSRPRETVETRRGHVARVLADLEARRAARDAAEGAA